LVLKRSFRGVFNGMFSAPGLTASKFLALLKAAGKLSLATLLRLNRFGLLDGSWLCVVREPRVGEASSGVGSRANVGGGDEEMQIVVGMAQRLIRWSHEDRRKRANANKAPRYANALLMWMAGLVDVTESLRDPGIACASCEVSIPKSRQIARSRDMY
jgi:hypothetical protein